MRFLIAGMVGFLPLLAWAAGPPQIPDYRRPLVGEQADRVELFQSQIDRLIAQGEFADALRSARLVVKTRTQIQGKRHWQTVDANQK